MENLRLLKDKEARKYLKIIVTDVMIATFLPSLGFYCALAFDGGNYTAFAIALFLLSLLGTATAVIGWWAWYKLVRR